MIFKDLPELVNEKSVYKTFISDPYSISFDFKLKRLERDFKIVVSAQIIEEPPLLKFWNGDTLIFSYRDDGLKMISIYDSPERYAMVIYDKDIYDFILKQGTEDSEEDYIVPTFDKAIIEPLEGDLRKDYISSLMHEYCLFIVSD